MPDLRYVIYAPPFDASNGGSIFLHELVHSLNSLGEQAFIWPMEPIYKMGFRKRLLNFLSKDNFKLSSELNTPVAKRRDLDLNTVVVYPEIVLGNPLNSKNVVRWLLYKPGLLHPFKFGSNELFFKAADGCDLVELTGGATDLFLWKVNKNYENKSYSNRSGACYIVRKGFEKPEIKQTNDAIKIDAMNHGEIAEIFNRCEVFYSYDEATMYSQYAAICGCTSVVIPGLFESREEWIKNHELGRYGVAYGLQDIAHAKSTMHLVEKMLREREEAGLETVKHFIKLTKEKFTH